MQYLLIENSICNIYKWTKVYAIFANRKEHIQQPQKHERIGNIRK